LQIKLHSSFAREINGAILRQLVGDNSPRLGRKSVLCGIIINRVLGRTESAALKEVLLWDDYLNMTYLALNLSHYVNGVAKRHAEVLRQMFSRYRIDAITNGVHATTWTSPLFQALFDQHVPGWREDNFTLRYALGIPPQDVWRTHEQVGNLYLRFERIPGMEDVTKAYLR